MENSQRFLARYESLLALLSSPTPSALSSLGSLGSGTLYVRLNQNPCDLFVDIGGEIYLKMTSKEASDYCVREVIRVRTLVNDARQAEAHEVAVREANRVAMEKRATSGGVSG